MLINNDISYLKELKRLANKRARGRITFHEAVLPEEIIGRICEYDIGLCLITPTNYNNLVSLPNKFFDYIIAGLAVCIGPSPSMVELVRKYRFGCVAPTFHPKDVAKTLNKLGRSEIAAMKKASREAAQVLNAGREMKNVVDLYKNLFTEN
jgi:hypothetical protein